MDSQTTNEITQKFQSTHSLIRLKRKAWNGNYADTDLRDEVALQKGADADTLAITIKLLSKSAELKTILALAGEAGNAIQKNTAPSGIDGLRLIPIVRTAALTKEIKEVIDRFNDAVRLFIAAYPRLKFDRIQELARLDKPGIWPDLLELAEKFSLTIETLPIPQNWDSSILKDMAETAETHAGEKLTEALTKAVYTLKNGTRLHATTIVETIAAVANIALDYNVSQDLKTIAAAEKLQALTATADIKEIRSNEETKKSYLANLEEVLGSLGMAVPEDAPTTAPEPELDLMDWKNPPSPDGYLPQPIAEIMEEWTAPDEDEAPTFALATDEL